MPSEPREPSPTPTGPSSADRGRTARLIAIIWLLVIAASIGIWRLSRGP